MNQRGRKELQAEADALTWFHTMELADGVRTRGIVEVAAGLDRYGFPDRLDGKTVLDVGAWDGFYSFEAERRGAARVVASDSFSWNGSNDGTKAAFELARRALGSSVEDADVDVLDLDPATLGGPFDVVLFLGVLYHMRHPMLALDRVAAMTRDMMILETAVDLCTFRRPAAVFYPRGELEGDPTNWWGPNPRAVVEMVGAAGFRRVEVIYRPKSAYRAARAVYRRVAKGDRTPLLDIAQRGRMTLHAWK